MSDILRSVSAAHRVRVPRFFEVRTEVLTDLAADYRPGDRLPSEPDLATTYGVSRPTIREVLRSLEGDGLVRRVHGVGTFVTQPPAAVSSRFDLDLGVTEAVTAANQQLGVQLIRAAVEPAPTPIAQRLDVAADSAVLWVERVIRVNDQPAAHVIDAIPQTITEGHTYEGGSIYRFLEESCGVELVGGVADVTAVVADTSLAPLLGIAPGTALLRVDQVERSTADRPVLFSSEHYVPTVLKVSVRRVRRGAPGSPASSTEAEGRP
ncbi:MAG TPA: GntR family transcriptional regulator [Candidatus Limnocylindrales bacterium]|nr:GntR family transcriptional regulator [Candidatus Limnocylindrales bacterium]